MKLRMLGPALLAVLGAAAASPLSAQPAPTAHEALVPGVKIRYFEPRSPRREIGVVEWVRGDTVSVRDATGNARVFLLPAAWPVEVYRGNDRAMGMMTSSLAGVAGGALGGYFFGTWAYDDPSGESSTFAALGGAMLGGAVGLVYGTIVGKPHWERLQRPAAIALQAAPAPEGGVAVGMTVTIP